MSSELIDALAALAKERNVDELIVLDRLEQELASAYEKILRLDWDARVTIDRESGKIYVYEMVGVGEEDPETGEYESYEEHDVTPDDVSRIAAGRAKRVINEIVKDAASIDIYRRYKDRKYDLVNGTVLQVTQDFTILKLEEGVEAELPHSHKPGERNERPANEHYRHNDHLKALIIDVREPSIKKSDGTQVRNESTRPPIVVSRTHPDLIRRLLEIEVPEIYDGIVEVKNVVRDEGVSVSGNGRAIPRSKIAVRSHDDEVDPVGACVGKDGRRIRAVVGELHGERIDVIPWDEDPSRYVANALSPAKVSRVVITNAEDHYATVIVPDDQCSLAIGKEGQNARLAARLTGWHIDIKPASFVDDADLEVEEEEVLFDNDEPEVVEPIDMRCAYVDESGTRCRNHARVGSQFCGIHAEEENYDDEEGLLI